ncbi:MAG: tryptophan--tRNA ligase, partial [Hydrogenimonas sp.]|nr:tryptophan--tRNA ligase [Hydrogenimonas sp.]
MRIVSGMRPTGKLHLGHYLGVLKNWVEFQESNDCRFFVADWHALSTSYEDKLNLKNLGYELVKEWIAAGIDPQRSTLFVQSAVKEHAELYVLLNMITPLGWLERNPTYKDQLEQMRNKEIHTAGFLTYPVLQTADIILYNADAVPIGEDQKPHLEIAREIVRRFHHLFGCEIFTEPKEILTQTSRLPGLDGRKMSKSYNNTIPLWLPEKKLRKAIMKIKTNSLEPGEPKDTSDSALFALYQAFATPAQTEAMRQAFADGIGWGDAKQQTFELINAQLAEPRARYHQWMENPARLAEV